MISPLSGQQRDRYPAPVADILAAQDAGYASFSDPHPTCPYPSSTDAGRFLRSQWAAGRALARVNAMDSAGMFDTHTDPQDGVGDG